MDDAMAGIMRACTFTLNNIGDKLTSMNSLVVSREGLGRPRGVAAAQVLAVGKTITLPAAAPVPKPEDEWQVVVNPTAQGTSNPPAKS